MEGCTQANQQIARNDICGCDEVVVVFDLRFARDLTI